MILGARDPFVWAGEAHTQGLARLELALVLRLVLLVWAEVLGRWERCALGLQQAPTGVDAIGAGHPDLALSVCDLGGGCQGCRVLEGGRVRCARRYDRFY